MEQKPTGLLNSIDEINTHLYISGYGPVIKQNLQKLSITCVVDATNVPNRRIDGIDYIKVAVDDSDFAKLELHFDHVVDKIEEHRENGGRTLVHCAAGISRSATLCMVYLVKYQAMTLKDAYFLVKEKRRLISPNNGFWRQMIAYEFKLKGRNSVKMLRGTYREIPDVMFAKNTNKEY